MLSQVCISLTIAKAQKVQNWPTLVAHGVPTSIPISDFKEEVENFNQQIHIQGQPRWLIQPKRRHGSVVFTIRSESEKTTILRQGILVGGLLLKPVNYQSHTQKTQCQRCLKFGHHHLLCKRAPLCSICHGAHLTSDHKYQTCQASEHCQHHGTKCANCQSLHHHAFQKQVCEFYQALL